MNPATLRYLELLDERDGRDPHGREGQTNGLERYMILEDLEHIDRKIASAELSIEILRGKADFYTEYGFRAITLEQQAEDIERELGSSDETAQQRAYWLREEARLLRAECLAWSTYLQHDQQTLAGLKMERAAMEKAQAQ